MKNHMKFIAIILCAVMACFVAFPSSSSSLEIIDQGLSEIEMPAITDLSLRVYGPNNVLIATSSLSNAYFEIV